MTTDPHDFPLFLRPLPAVGVCSRCGRAGGCNCAAQAPEAPRLLTPAEVAALVATARREGAEAMREACARTAVSAPTNEPMGGPRTDMRSGIYAAIRALPLPEDKP